MKKYVELLVEITTLRADDVVRTSIDEPNNDKDQLITWITTD